jgi:hypothetical protein
VKRKRKRVSESEFLTQLGLLFSYSSIRNQELFRLYTPKDFPPHVHCESEQRGKKRVAVRLD